MTSIVDNAHRRQPLRWSVGFTRSSGAAPDRRVPATVPGAVQLDWARAEGWPDYTFGGNYKAYAWMEDVYWAYSAILELPECAPGERVFFVSKGIDYQFQVRLNGRLVHEQEGMFTPVELDLTGRVKSGDALEILVFPAPKSRPSPPDRVQANQSCKPAASYGWDWHPRLIPLGIWDETYLEVRPATHIRRAEVTYELSADCSKVDLRLSIETGGVARARWNLIHPDGTSAVSRVFDVDHQSSVEAVLEQPALWWPNGEGDPALYSSIVELFDAAGSRLDAHRCRVGFRRVRLIMHPRQWEEPSQFPKSCSTPPITLEINGRPIFCKGSNWVNAEVFPGVITAETYRPLLQLAKDAHMNLLRIWGGGIINKASFYDQCDELGLMVWQEFPLACNNYEGTPAYMRVLDQESRSIIMRLRPHACLALWCGGNELFNSWSGMTDQSLALRLLNRNCYDLDSKTPFLVTAPVMGMGHGHYMFRDGNGHEVYQTMPLAGNTAYTEFGCAGPSPADYLRSFIPVEELFPPKPGTAWEDHHGFNSWFPETWLQLSLIQDYFGPSEDLETLTARGQWLQSEGCKALFEEARRQKPVCSMALNWCFNEPWPTAANCSIINWPANPKPSYHAVALACRPTLASARIPKFKWTEGEWFTPELWMLHDSPARLQQGRVEACLEIDGEEVFLLGWDFKELPPNTNLPGPTIRFQLGRWSSPRMRLVLRVPGRPGLDSHYDLVYCQKEKSAGPATAALNL